MHNIEINPLILKKYDNSFTDDNIVDTFLDISPSDLKTKNAYENLSCNIYQKQLKHEEIENLNQIEKQLNVDVRYISIILQKPGSINAHHFDKFWKLKNEHDKRRKIRVNIFLNEWRFGQLVVTPELIFSNWSIGDASIWDNTVEHFALNLSGYNKFTLQLTGYQNDF